MKKKLKAFTLAEVLITLAIVGVVAAITMPALIANIQERVKTACIQNIKQKFSKATDKMLSVTTLNGYGSTMEFVNELQNHLKIAKICTNDKLNECWPTEEVILDDEGNTWAIKETKKAKNLKMPENDSVDYDDTVGIVTADGTAMILTYDKKCDIDENKTITWSNDQSSTTGCIGAIFDWNGSKMPNKWTEDVVALNAVGGLGKACFFEINGSCFKAPILQNSWMYSSQCDVLKEKLGLQSCLNNSATSYMDYYAAGVNVCGHVNKLPTQDDLAAIATKLYGQKIVGAHKYYSVTYNMDLGASLSFPTPSFTIWTQEHDTRGYVVDSRIFQASQTTYAGTYRYDRGVVLCKE